MRPLKVLLACDWFAPQIGGIESHIADLARELHRRGHAVHVLTSTGGPAELDGVRVHRLDVQRIPRWNVVLDPRTVRHVRALCERERFDLVHGHSLQSPLAHVAMYAARRLLIPSVLTQHSVLGTGATRLLRGLGGPLAWASWPTVMTAVSSVAARRASVAAGRHVHVLHTGIDLSTWSRRRSVGEGPTTVVSVTRLFAHKHTDELLHAIRRVLQLVEPARELRFVIVGDGPERATLERLSRRLGIASSTAFLGALPRAGVARVLERSHVFVLPNPDEAFGIAALEARALGLPVVARAQSGARDLIEDGRHGYLCETVDDMALSIATLCTNAVVRHSMSRHASEGLDAFGWGSAMARHLEIYKLAMRTKLEPALSNLQRTGSDR